MAVVAYGRAFNGTNAYVEIPMVGEAGTRMLWVYLSPGGVQNFMSYHTYDQNGSNWIRPLFSYNDGVLYATARDRAQTYAEYSASFITSSRWVHLAVLKIGSSVALYVNGVLRNTKEIPALVSFAVPNGIDPNPISYPGLGSPGSFWSGKVADVRFYTETLTSNRIAAIYNKGVIDSSPDTVSCTDVGLPQLTMLTINRVISRDGVNHNSTQASFGEPDPLATVPTSQEATNITATKFDANWQTSFNAPGYKLDVSTVADFASYVTGFENLDVGNVLTKQVLGLDQTIYYYRVRAYNVAGTASNNSLIQTVSLQDDSYGVSPNLTLLFESVNEGDVIPIRENKTFVKTCIAAGGDGTALTYSLNGGADAAKFAISSTTGVLSFLTAPNHEVPTDADTDNDYVVILSVTDNTVTAGVTLTVRILNYFEPSAGEGFNEDELTPYILNSQSDIVQFETIELSHPDFETSHRVVRNKTDGLTAILETDETVNFTYLPLTIEEVNPSGDLDYALTVIFGDLGEVIPLELDRIEDTAGLFTEVILTYRSYRSDDLSKPMIGPIRLNVKSFLFDKEGVVIQATSTKTNSQNTGDTYSLNRFPMLRAFL